MCQVQRHDQHIRYTNFHYDHTRAAWLAAAYVGHGLETVDMLALAAHVYELGLCPNKYQQRAKNRTKYTTAHQVTGPRGPRKDNASIIAVISAVLLECILAPEKAR